IELLQKAGAKGSGPTLKLFEAIRKKNVVALNTAIREGADVNRLTPPPGAGTALSWVSTTGAEEMVAALLEAGAEPNKYDADETPLIRAARCGHLRIVKRLIAAGADIHMVGLRSEYPDNAYSAAVG